MTGGSPYESSALDLGEGLIKFRLRVHHDRPAPCHGFTQGPPGDNACSNMTGST